MKPKKSNAELQIEEAINHMQIMIKKQPVSVQDAEYLISTACKVLYKCEELRNSRDRAIQRRDEAQDELKQFKLTK